MKAREFFAASGRPGSDRVTVDDLIALDEGRDAPAPDSKAAPQPPKQATQDEIDRVNRGEGLLVGGAPGGPTAVRDAGSSSSTTAKKGGARKR